MDGKGHKPRTVGLDSGATATIQRWANRRREAGAMAAQVRALREPGATTVQPPSMSSCPPLACRPEQPPRCSGVLGRLLAELNADRPLAGVTGDKIASVLRQL